ncbi:primase-helicase family protein [Pseudomonas sp. BNK-15]|uniref:primase-helicase family protein n=1 Tax=Pseudomonas sp. BNK-15 TaxID=3376152 RepID=UPI0039BF0F8A
MSTNDSCNQDQAPRAAGIRWSAESKETLDLISEDFILLSSSDKPFYHKRSGDQLNEKGFRHFCAKHYGSLEGEKSDKDGNTTEKRLNSGELWGNPDFNIDSRRVVRRIVMEPTRTPESDCDLEVYNRWFVLKEEMVTPHPTATPNDIAIFLNHLMYISDGDKAGVAFFLNWLAQLYQTPDVKLPSAIVLYSKFGGVGKSMLWDLLKEVFGHSMVGTCNGASLNKSFDDVTEHKRILFVNEMAKSDRADGYERFKNMISEEQVSFEGKGKAARDIRNITHYVVTTNNDDALPLMEGDRRVLVLRCSAQPKEPGYYKELGAWMAGPGPALLAGVLSRWQFPAEWDPKAPVPQTEASREMQHAARSALVSFIDELVQDGKAPFDRDLGRCTGVIEQLGTLYPTATKGFRLDPVSLAKAFRALEYSQVNAKATRAADKAWCWRNFGCWDSQSPKVFNAHIGQGVTPPGYPNVALVQGGADHGRA